VKEEDLESTLSALRKMGVGGLNLTMPLKEAVLPLCDSLSKEAKLSSSVNTLVFSENGKMTGCSTDGIGFFRALGSENGVVNGKKLCLMGLGGAGKAILSRAVYTEISEIRLLQRASSIEKNRAFIEKVERETGKQILLGSYEENLAEFLEQSDILVNSTNVGMGAEASLIPEVKLLHKALFVADCIYHPFETKLLSQAREAGLRYMNGLPMLFYQAVEAFRLWTGKSFPEEEVLAALQDKLKF
jgi:shikimate dehydrogenase